LPGNCAACDDPNALGLLPSLWPAAAPSSEPALVPAPPRRRGLQAPFAPGAGTATARGRELNRLATAPTARHSQRHAQTPWRALPFTKDTSAQCCATRFTGALAYYGRLLRGGTRADHLGAIRGDQDARRARATTPPAQSAAPPAYILNGSCAASVATGFRQTPPLSLLHGPGAPRAGRGACDQPPSAPPSLSTRLRACYTCTLPTMAGGCDVPAWR
jgi:hypothetical protein